MKDLEIKKLLDAEKRRQKSVINLIASENYVSADVLTALGSELTNKYSEGYPGKRYYGGNEIVDKVEVLAQKRALKLFGLSDKKWAVNVQPLSGSPANLAVYTALLPKDGTGKIMGMSLDHGGHLTHGHKASVTGKFFIQIPFGVDPKTEVIDYDAIKLIAIKEKPHIIVAGFTAYPRRVDWKKFRDIADASGALLMVDMSHISGLIAGKAYPSPFPYADIVTTTTHKSLRGPRSALIFSKKSVEVRPLHKDLSAKIDKAVFPGLQGGPHNNNIAAVAVALKEAMSPKFKSYAKQVMKNAKVLASELEKKGWRIVSGGTDSHMVLVDVWMDGKGGTKGQKSLSGSEASDKLEKAGIIVNKNTIPGETRSAFDPSGIRLGTCAETTRGKKEKDFKKIAEKIDKVLKSH
jgi:glycine hydroxymethyltransferase